MANHKSALKRARQSETRRARNRINKTKVKHAVKKVRSALGESPEAAAEARGHEGGDLGGEEVAQDADQEEGQGQEGQHLAEEALGRRQPASSQGVGENRHEGHGQGALGQEAAQEVGDAESHHEGRRRWAVAEKRGRDLVPGQAGQPRQQGRPADYAGRAGYLAVGFHFFTL